MRLGTILVFAGGAILFSSVSARAGMESGRLTQDITVGASHDIKLKTDQIVQVLKHSAQTAVIMVQLADGSSGIFQINAAALEMIAPGAAAPAGSVPIPATTNAAPAIPAAPATAAPASPAATAPATPPTKNAQTELNPSDSGHNAKVFFSELKGHLVIQEDDQTKSFDDSTLQGVKYWAFYFSTSWCPDCKAFTPKLVSFYKEFKPENPNFELILVCEDKTEEPMLNYLKTEGMPWPALRFSDIWNRTQHAMKYAARGIPNLVLVDENGKVLSSTYKGTEHLGSEEQILQSGKVMDDIKKLVPKPAL